jgi:spiro-SPASM protein
MNALLVLYGGNLSKYAFEPVLNGKNSVELAVEQGKKFPGVKKTVLLAAQGDFSNLNGVQVEQRDAWTKRCLLEKTSELQEGFDLIYFAFADCPFLDPELAGAVAERHLRYKAEYSYADGWPYGIAPETLSPGTAGILAKISGEDGAVERDILFSVIQKDINAFDIEAEISSVDLRCHRINLCADSKRSYLLLKNFLTANSGKLPAAAVVEKIVMEQPEILRTLPSFYPIQVYGGCPQKCTLCPYPVFTDTASRKDFMGSAEFEALLDKIAAFSGDAVIDLSLWGELSLHPEKMKLIEAVISRKELSLVIETSGIGWKNDELEKCADLTKNRVNSLFPALSWIVSLDTADSQKYMELRGPGFAEAESTAKKLLSIFPNDCYVQAVRVKGSEEDTEKFYRYWKETAKSINESCGEKNIIIQKYDDFCGTLEKKQASDISPVIRQSCWHIMRDMPVLIDGSVPLCRENMEALKGETNFLLGNVFNDSLENIWRNGERFYKEHCKKNYNGTLLRELCADCDEYYTYNF